MACPECAEFRQRAERVEEAEQLLLLFTDTFSRLSQALMAIDVDRGRKRYAENPPAEGAQPNPKWLYILSPVDFAGRQVRTE